MMRHLRLFESIGDKYELLVDTNEYHTSIDLYFSDKERDALTTLMQKYQKYPSDYNKLCMFDADESIRIGLASDQNKISAANQIILRKSPDEWYFVRCLSLMVDNIYKCDQFDGMIECLRDKIYNEVFNDTWGKLIYESTNDKSDPPYEEITYSEYCEYKETYIGITIPRKEINDIVEFLNTNWSHPDIVQHGGQVLKLELNRYDSLIIRKMEDDWYFVRLTSISDHDDNIYKCDQWEGLLKCLEEKILSHPVSESKILDPTYEETTYSEWEKLLKNRSIRFGEDEVEYIIGMVWSYDPDRSEKWTSTPPKMKVDFLDQGESTDGLGSLEDDHPATIKILMGNMFRRQINIGVLDDEWYIVIDHDYYSRTSGSKCYKCDQWEGLNDCIKMIMSK